MWQGGGGVVVPFTFISYLDCSYYTTEERETFGEKKITDLLRGRGAETDKHIDLILVSITYCFVFSQAKKKKKKVEKVFWHEDAAPADLVLHI